MTGSRRGSASRRRWEFVAIVRRVRADKEGFIALLERNLERRGECLCWRLKGKSNGYAGMGFWDPRKQQSRTIDAQRLFLILRLARPIRPGFEAGHTQECRHRTCVRHLVEQALEGKSSAARPPEQEAGGASAGASGRLPVLTPAGLS